MKKPKRTIPRSSTALAAMQRTSAGPMHDKRLDRHRRFLNEEVQDEVESSDLELCPLCDGVVRLVAGAVKTAVSEGVEFNVPATWEFPTCERCKTSWETAELSAALDAEARRQRQ